MKKLLSVLLALVLLLSGAFTNFIFADEVQEVDPFPTWSARWDPQVLEEEAFYGDKSLISFEFGDNVEYIGDYAFAYTGLSYVKFSDKIWYIGEHAFEGCNNIVAEGGNNYTKRYCAAHPKVFGNYVDPDMLPEPILPYQPDGSYDPDPSTDTEIPSFYYVADGIVNCRAILIGEENTQHEKNAVRFRNSVNDLANALSSLKSPSGKDIEITRKYNLTTGQLLTQANRVFQMADDDDITIIYIATHGQGKESDSRSYGDINTTDNGILPLHRLGEFVSLYRGTKVVILELCMSGVALGLPEFQGDDIILLTGGSGREATSISLFGQRNVFTTTLCRALSIENSDSDPKDQALSLKEIYKYLSDNIESVHKELMSMGAEHTPTLKCHDASFKLFTR